ncbi:MAG TPA: phosphotransferase, partial [Chthonomonadales bacterium]|nr:phosphotransferase [Chthonomonadales bacterium]
RWAGREEIGVQRLVKEAVSGSPTLLHLDFHPNNVLIDGDAVTGVIDWSGATAGDRRADLARAIVLLRQFQLETELDWQRIAAAEFEVSMTVAYERSKGKMPEMDRFLAWAWAFTFHDQANKLTGESSFRPSARRMEILERELRSARRKLGV